MLRWRRTEKIRQERKRVDNKREERKERKKMELELKEKRRGKIVWYRASALIPSWDEGD